MKRIVLKRSEMNFDDLILQYREDLQRVFDLWDERFRLHYDRWYSKKRGKRVMELRIDEIDEQIRDSVVWKWYQNYGWRVLGYNEKYPFSGMSDGSYWDEYKVGAYISELKRRLAELVANDGVKGRDLKKEEKEGEEKMGRKRKEEKKVVDKKSVFLDDAEWIQIVNELKAKAKKIEGYDGLYVSRRDVANVFWITPSGVKSADEEYEFPGKIYVKEGSAMAKVYYNVDVLVEWMEKGFGRIVKWFYNRKRRKKAFVEGFSAMHTLLKDMGEMLLKFLAENKISVEVKIDLKGVNIQKIERNKK